MKRTRRRCHHSCYRLHFPTRTSELRLTHEEDDCSTEKKKVEKKFRKKKLSLSDCALFKIWRSVISTKCFSIAVGGSGKRLPSLSMYAVRGDVIPSPNEILPQTHCCWLSVAVVRKMTFARRSSTVSQGVLYEPFKEEKISYTDSHIPAMVQLFPFPA